MDSKLKCFISAPHEVDTSSIKNTLAIHDVESLDIYDFSIGDSIQQILKKKIREADFALFILTNDSANVLYEMGVCEGIGKQHFVFIEKGYKIPFYISNKLFFNDDIKEYSFLELSIGAIIQEVKKNKKTPPRYNNNKSNELLQYSSSIKLRLSKCLDEISEIRAGRYEEPMNTLVHKIFTIIGVNFIETEKQVDRRIDFVLWNDKLGQLLGNQILVELKQGKINGNTLNKARNQIIDYAREASVFIGLILYLDTNDKRIDIRPSLSPLILHYDLEDFIKNLLNKRFEDILIEQRNNIAHNVI